MSLGLRHEISRRWTELWPPIVVGCLVVVYVVWTQAGLGGPVVTQAFSDITIGLAAGAAGVACVAASRRHGGWPGRGWLLIGLGMLSWALGEAIWTYYEVVLRVEVPFPSLADPFFLLMVPLTLVGMAAGLNFHRSILRTLFDGVMVSGSLLLISWPMVLEPTYQAADQAPLARTIALAYPIGDIVVATMAFLLLSQGPRQARGTWALAGIGMLSLAVADSGFAYLTANEAYASASVIDPGWFIGFLLIVLAGWRRYHTEAWVDSRRAGPQLVMLPYVPLAAAIVTTTVLQVTRGSLSTFLYALLMFLVLCVILRQLVTLRENLTLTRRLHITVEELTDAEGKLRHLAYHDPLTGLANRAMLQESTERAVAGQRTAKSLLGIVYVDLDDFKPVNDRLGHAAGDAVLVMVAQRMRDCTRATDTVARLGGDEFVVLVPGLADDADAESLGRRLVDTLSRPFHLGDQSVQIGASVGVAVQPAGVVGDPLREADIAMFNAKFSGKNTVVRFEPTLRDRIATTA